MKKEPPTTIDAYIATFPAEVQDILRRIRALIREEAPAATEAMSYQIPTYKLKRNLVHFAAFKKHVGFYPGPSGIAHFQDRLAAYPSAKGSVRFPLDQPIPYELMREITRFRVREEEAKTKMSPARK